LFAKFAYFKVFEDVCSRQVVAKIETHPQTLIGLKIPKAPHAIVLKNG
jgi:hypothetical protein